MEETPPVKIEPHSTLNVGQCPQSPMSQHPLELEPKTITEILRVYQLSNGYAVPVSSVRKRIDNDMSDSSLSSCLRTLFGPDIRVVGGYCINLGMVEHHKKLACGAKSSWSSKVDAAKEKSVVGEESSCTETEDNELNLLVTDVRSTYVSRVRPQIQSKPHRMNMKLRAGDSTIQESQVGEADTGTNSLSGVTGAPQERVLTLKLENQKIQAQILKVYQRRLGSFVLLSTVRQRIGTNMSDSALSSCLNILFGKDTCVMGEYCVNLSLIDFSRQNKKKIPQEKETDLSAKKPTMRTQPTIVEGTKVLWPFGSTKRNTERHMVSKTNKAKEKQGESEENALVSGVPVVMTDDNHIVSVVDEEQKSQNEVERENEVGEPCSVDSQLKKSKNKLTDDQIAHPVQRMIAQILKVYQRRHGSFVLLSSVRQRIGTNMSASALSSCINILFEKDVYVIGDICVNLGRKDSSRQETEKVPLAIEAVAAANKKKIVSLSTVVTGTKMFWTFGSTKQKGCKFIVSHKNQAKPVASETTETEEKQSADEEYALEPGDHVVKSDDHLIVCAMADEQNSQTKLAMEQDVGEPGALDSQKTQNSGKLMVTKTNETKDKQEEPGQEELITGSPEATSDENHIVSVLVDEQESQNEVEREQDVKKPRAVDSQLGENKEELTDKQMVHLIQEKISETCVHSHMDTVEMSDIIAMMRVSGLQLPVSPKTLRKLTIQAVMIEMKYMINITTRTKGNKDKMETLIHMKWREPELGMETVEAKEQTSTTWLATDAQVISFLRVNYKFTSQDDYTTEKNVLQHLKVSGFKFKQRVLQLRSLFELAFAKDIISFSLPIEGKMETILLHVCEKSTLEKENAKRTESSSQPSVATSKSKLSKTSGSTSKSSGQPRKQDTVLPDLRKFLESNGPPSQRPCNPKALVNTVEFIVRKRVEYTTDDSTVELSQITDIIRQLGLPTSISDFILAKLTKRAVLRLAPVNVAVNRSDGRELCKNVRWKASFQPNNSVALCSTILPHTNEIPAQARPDTVLPDNSPSKPPANLSKVTDASSDNAPSTSLVSTVPHTAKTPLPKIIKSVNSSGRVSGDVDSLTSTNLMREYQGADLEKLEQFVLKHYDFSLTKFTPIMQVYTEIIEAGFHVKKDQLLWLIRKIFSNKIVIDTHKREFFIGLGLRIQTVTLSSSLQYALLAKDSQQHTVDRNDRSRLKVSLSVNEFEALRCLKEGKILKAIKLVHPAEEEDAAQKKVMMAAKKIMRDETRKFASSSASDILKDQNPVTVGKIRFLDLFNMYQEQLPLTMEFFRPCFSMRFPEYKEQNDEKAESKESADKDRKPMKAYQQKHGYKTRKDIFTGYNNGLITERKRTAALVSKMLALMFHNLSAYRQYVFSFLVSGNASTQVMFDLAQLGDSLYPAHLKAMRNNPQKHFKRCWGSEEMELEMKAVFEKVEKHGPPSWSKRHLKQVNFSERSKSWQEKPVEKRVDVSDSAEDGEQQHVNVSDQPGDHRGHKRVVSDRRKGGQRKHTSVSKRHGDREKRQENSLERHKDRENKKRSMTHSSTSSLGKEHAVMLHMNPENREFYDMAIYPPGTDPQIPVKRIKLSEQSEPNSTSSMQSDQSLKSSKQSSQNTESSMQSDPNTASGIQSDQIIASSLHDSGNSESLPKLPEIKQQSMSDSHPLDAAVSDVDSIDAIEILESLLSGSERCTERTSNVTQELDAANILPKTSQHNNITQDDNTQSNPHNTADSDADSTETGEEEELVDSDEDPEYVVSDVEFYGSDKEW